MTAPLSALQQYDEQAALASATVKSSVALWRELDPSAITSSWISDEIGARIFLALATAQELAATRSDAYLTRVLAEQGLSVNAEGKIIPLSLAGVSSDGRPLEDLLMQPIITTMAAQQQGATLSQAMLMGENALIRIVGTQVQDISRTAHGVGVAVRPRTGWVRMLTPPSCGRCAILAGRFYRWSDGFERHPLCNCVNVPSVEDSADDIRTDPKAYFNSLSEADQNKHFGAASAKAIRDGADPSQVVNARRKKSGLSTPGAGNTGQRVDVYGRKLLITSEGTSKRGVAGRKLIEESGSTREFAGTANRISKRGAVKRDIYTERSKIPRLMPESIYEIATDRDDAIRLLKRYGYIETRDPRIDAQNAAAKRARETFAANKANQR